MQPIVTQLVPVGLVPAGINGLGEVDRDRQAVDVRNDSSGRGGRRTPLGVADEAEGQERCAAVLVRVPPQPGRAGERGLGPGRPITRMLAGLASAGFARFRTPRPRLRPLPSP